jgi:predicted nucleic acid-binding protein
MTFLVDAIVLSEATRPRPDGSVLAWLSLNEAELAVTPIILGELQYGILLLPPGRRRERLLEWFAAGVEHLPVIDLDAETGRVWATLLAELKRKGRAMPVKDSLIAATARQHRLTVATRNTSDFAHAGVKVVNPFEG